MKPPHTDIHAPPCLQPNPIPLTGLTVGPVHTVCALVHHQLAPPSGAPLAPPLPPRLLLVLIHLRTNLTTLALAALLGTSGSTVDRIVHQLVPVLADAPGPHAAGYRGPWIIDATLIPVHDQLITAPSKNYPRSINAHIIITAKTRHVITVGHCRPRQPQRRHRRACHRRRPTRQRPRGVRRRRQSRHQHHHHTPTRPDRPHRPRPALPSPPSDHSPRRARHRPAQRLADTAPMPPPRPRHQRHASHRRRTLEP